MKLAELSGRMKEADAIKGIVYKKTGKVLSARNPFAHMEIVNCLCIPGYGKEEYRLIGVGEEMSYLCKQCGRPGRIENNQTYCDACGPGAELVAVRGDGGMSKCEGFYIDAKTKTFYDRTGRALMTYHDPEFAEHVENLLLERWISVKERLPEPGDYVLVVDKHEYMTVAEFAHGRFWPDSVYINQVTITHWQPLPAPPKE